MSDDGGDRLAVSVVIPCRNEASTIGELLEFLLAVTGEEDEILVADGMSDDGTRGIVEGFAARDRRVALVDNPGLHVSSGLNRAIRASGGAYVLRMDAHTRYAPDYIEACIGELERTGADNVGGPQLADGRGYVGGAIAAACLSPIAVGGSRIHDPDYEGPSDSVIYGCWRRSLFDRVGLFDEELVRNQDGEHNRRIAAAGGLIRQTPRIRSWYTPRGDLLSLGGQYEQYGYWKAREIRTFRAVRSWRHLAPGLFVAALAALAVGGLASRRSLGLAGALGAAYLLFLALSAICLCVRRGGWRFLPVIPAAFAFMQLGYGIGFLRGAWDSWVLGRPARARFTRLTRRSGRAGDDGPPGRSRKETEGGSS
ncbi:MAG: glycosyltransferase family 2 protein [Candidatus Krumholzibacteriota bacterium]|nr:glycosyltransferase family 2 protein [Candidatus Krumholzibacteriota bacterium]